MAQALIVALSTIIAASAVSAAKPEPVPATAPAGTETTRYCMYIEPIIGSRLETVRCWTRAEWAVQDVDVDKDWPKDGIKVVE